MEFLADVAGGSDLLKPSYFEVIAQEQLRDLLAPVVKYVLSVLAQRNPRYLLRIVNRHDEFFALVMFFVERHYLKTWGASFAENFYGLKRRKVIGSGSDRTKAALELTGRTEALGPKEIRASLVFLILVPYVRSKAQDLYETLGGGADEDLFGDSGPPPLQQQLHEIPPLRERMLIAAQKTFKTAYPYVNVAYELYLLSYNIRYLFDKTPYWRPWLSWMGVDVRRMSSDDYVCPSQPLSVLVRTNNPPPPPQQAAQAITSSLHSSPLASSPSGVPPSYPTIALRTLALIPRLSLEGLKFALPTAIFFFRFLEWWYGSEGGHGRIKKRTGADARALRAPPKATISLEIKNVLGQKVEKGMCVVHGGVMVNPTALPSGWLGCYKCLFVWVEEKGACPITGANVEVEELRKIVG